MKFSILVANYNNGRFFKDCFLSICTQTCQDWEVVILDDASTDNSVSIIKEIIADDSRFRLYENNENKGVGFTKSKLIDLAKCEICGYLDPDDALRQNALQSSINVFQEKKDVVLTYSRLVKCDENLKPIDEFQAAMQVPNGDRHFFNCPIQIAPFVGFKKSVYLECEKMNNTLKIAEDQDLYLKLYEKGKVYFINQTDYLYRAHAGGISQNENKQKSYDFWAIAIYNAMKRRELKLINGKKVPEKFTSSAEVFDLLKYQNRIPYRIKKKLKLIFQSLF